ncbi:rhodanese-like domain-containing protein [Legionella nagasakiensis]|uniref:rhodanese-like domain-containing protein n=1 Tax=Legionella nagasakiensis TaxID=535290 RepID=UPI001056633F|nr:rhodanese-like domain-containing protein [Legionella nagasakiensis]
MDIKKAEEYFAAKMEFTTGPVELDHTLKKNKDKVNIIDVRLSEDYKKGHIPGAVNLPKHQWDDTSASILRKDQVNVLYCYTQVCHLAANAALKFAKQGYPVMELEGGFKTWKEHNLDIEQ